MDERDRTYRHEQREAPVHNALSGEAEALRRYRARRRQRPNGQCEQRTVGDTWVPSLPGGSPYGPRAGNALQARGNTITAEHGAGAVSLSGAGSVPAGWHP
jgi:hypothetical protein